MIVGQDAVIDQVLMALFTGGHCLITGVPGLAKTLLIKTLAEILDLSFKRIQFTPDLMPADITGTEVLDEDAGHRSLRFVKGPIFAQILLADEINRTPPKTQAALLEAMQEYHVTAAGRTYPLERPFFVLATQNPIELEGTYPLPEAQLDRFMFNIVVSYLTEDDEVRVVTQTTGDRRAGAGAGAERRRRSWSTSSWCGRWSSPRRWRATRCGWSIRRGRDGRQDLPFVKDWVKWGAGLRASQSLILASKARALMQGRYHVSVADIRALAHPILRHRIIPNFYAESEKVTSDILVDRLIEAVPRAAQRYVDDACDRPPRRDVRFLDPAVIARLGSMELKARTVVEGFLSGLHRSPYKGFSVEFAEYRQYLPGDDLSTLDWKVYARTDRHYIKKFEEETNLECHLLLDVSASMALSRRRGDEQARVRQRARGVAGLPDEPAARRHRADRVRREDHRRGCRRSARPGTCTRSCWRSRRSRRARGPNVGRPLHQLADALGKRSLAVAHLRSARRSGQVVQRAEAPALPRHRRDRLPAARSARDAVSVQGRRRASPTSRAPTT